MELLKLFDEIDEFDETHQLIQQMQEWIDEVEVEPEVAVELYFYLPIH